MANAQITVRHTALSALLALAACGGGDDQAAANGGLANDADPALTSALADQIAVDPQLSQQSNQNAVRTPETPAQAQYPATGGMRAPEAIPASAGTGAQQAQLGAAASGEGGVACPGGARWDYNMGWAQRLSPTFPVYPGGRVTEAAGANQGDCRVRVVSFTTADPYQRVLDWYHTQAVRAGYSSEHQLRDSDHVLAGSNEAEGGAFYLIVTPRPNGSEVALIANKGR
ncbi:hypothetical protein E2493_20360 [Sphingomonas parva]|uniref:Lipoprotein n=1 Tax=Sphingomonas parva TaxID=2555898 RepID=A0A4Y8ZPL9_9SPHN|nr:hypothetical protein [Sphingomonas parva]TFI56406.1 hypothetical protein E2493_20360 [Sphingomonas parva]